MKVDFKKLTATTLSVAMLASLSGCALFDKDDDAVLEVAGDYAEAIKKFKAADILELVADPSFTEDDINDHIDTDPTLYGEDYEAICSAIAGTLDYTIDEESVESSKKDGKASVDITFTIADYAAAYDSVTSDGGDLDAYLDAIADADTQEIEITVDFVRDDDAWLVDDEDGENIQKVYAFYIDALDYSFAAAISPDLIEEIEWYYSDNGVYTDVYTIELDIIPVTEAQEIEWQFTYEYYLDGALIYTSDACTDQGYWIESYYGTGYDSAAAVDENGYLIAGSYECIVYDMAGNVLADSTCTVENGGSTTDVPVVDDGDIAQSWSNGVEEYWYSYSDGSGYAMDTGDYTTDETIIEFTCQVYDEDTFAYYPVYYEVYYSADGDIDDAEQVYTGTITPSEYSNGYFYEFQYVDNSGLDAGSYYFVGGPDASGDVILFTAQAEVS